MRQRLTLCSIVFFMLAGVTAALSVSIDAMLLRPHPSDLGSQLWIGAAGLAITSLVLATLVLTMQRRKDR